MITDKHVLITGGGTGIGRAIAELFAKKGAKVTITGRRSKILQEVAMTSTNISALKMDVSDEKEVSDIVAEAVSKFGPIQICIANAGIAEGRKLQNTDLDFWRKIISTNLDGTFLTIREAMKSMLETDWGRVIAISSIAGIKGLKGAGAYSASKHGVLGLIKTYSEEYIGGPITFNAICPGYVNTPIIDNNIKAMMSKGISENDAQKLMVNSNPHKKLIEADEIAQTALWLCSQAAKSINGQAIEISGGKV
ncbi:MAG: SDR family oxidoreductase [Paracoccaceae bacterium]|jgi:NAD(P)-dependent dehydrogenase (short-subunit alcohol dehydrogenase family)|nr:SDR family oxidoreductase [Paracoccaceae bacterium]MEC7252387.1 SDR family oxidoreductase [Pseudomonadota bacterium]NCV48644.1 SDR family oxidoreductase [Rhodobacterales bacterium]NCW06430.1 SDR family oxidoreductase [Rhodobacterales bacterium]NCX28515.1 SDR family oxidoreductase [Rhodobacterales bacterium]|tara:strand:- start:149 stop:901 length:753 start_codon:yes stop_codon:yes gene_type:complete